MPTRRETIAELLRRGPQTPRELAIELGMRVKDLLSDLEHLQKSHKRHFVIEPAECRGCDFVFRERRRLGTPSRCPRCRSEHTAGPWLSIR